MIGTLAVLFVTLVVHVPLQLNSGAPTPPKVLAAYERAFHRLGPVVDHPGVGSWRPRPGARLTFDPDDHVFITTTLPQARSFLTVFLPRLRRELHQQATLGEIFGGWYGGAATQRERVDAVLPLACRCAARVAAIHAVFAGAGGASEYNDLDGTHIYSSVPRSATHAITAELRRLAPAPTITRTTFVLSY